MIMLPIYYASHDGHTRLITETIADRLHTLGIEATAVDIRDAPDEISGLPLFVLLSAIRFGYHLPRADRALKRFAALPQRPPLALASINLTARKPEKNTPETNRYFQKWIARHAVTPALAQVFAGKLDYPRYNLWERVIIQLIMTMTKGETNPTAIVDFTNWQQVSDWADEIAAFLAANG